ncbi:hypothetical protein TFLX_03682 [Thermoflexales bacterium]|nr:hypothetical protein TFLX_03682 [Thermoflexales bacterium]
MSRFPTTLRVFFLAFVVYALSAQVWTQAISLAPHYVYLAQSLLHGHVDLIQLPPTTYDLLNFKGQWFVAGSPMPSILMLPFVAIFGVGFSDVLFSIVLGAIDVVLVYSLLGIFHRRDAENAEVPSEKLGELSVSAVDSISISESARRWITLLFALGTPFWYLAALGTYWFTAQVVVVFFALLATREALMRQRWFLVGLWLACAGFARPTALFLAPFFLIVMVYAIRSRANPTSGTRQQRIAYSILRNGLLFGAALALGLAAHFVYNHARFKSFTDFGYAYVTGADNITSVYARYGGFNLRFVPCNLAVSLLSPPEVKGAVPAFITQACAYLLEGVNLADTSAPITPNPLGMSIFFVTPALLITFSGLGQFFKRRNDPDSRLQPESFRPVILAAWIGLLATLIPLWFYHNTGSLQFGWRYVFDAAPMWIILLAAGMQKVTRLKQGLILVSIAINLWGLLWIFEKLIGKPWGT